MIREYKLNTAGQLDLGWRDVEFWLSLFPNLTQADLDNPRLFTPNLESMVEPKKKEQEWEIQSFGFVDAIEYRLFKNGAYGLTEGSRFKQYFFDNNIPIKSVKRLSDGETFSVGDKVNCDKCPESFSKQTIEKFIISDSGAMIASCAGVATSINNISKRQPVFFEMYPNPTEKDLASPEFNAIWNAIKEWDIQRQKGLGYAGASGSDVMHILECLRNSISKQQPPQEEQKGNDVFWTDELVLEFLSFTLLQSPIFQGRYADLEQFKKNKILHA